jgi:hypothetical protein
MRCGYPAAFNAGTPEKCRSENLSRTESLPTVLAEDHACLAKPREDAISGSRPALSGIPKSG